MVVSWVHAWRGYKPVVQYNIRRFGSPVIKSKLILGGVVHAKNKIANVSTYPVLSRFLG